MLGGDCMDSPRYDIDTAESHTGCDGDCHVLQLSQVSLRERST